MPDPYFESDQSGYFPPASFYQGIGVGKRKGHNEGFEEGHEEGYNKGHGEGYAAGFDEGNTHGWNRCVDQANVTINTLGARIRELEADPLRNPQEMIELRSIINSLNETNQRLETRIKEVEQENAALKQQNTTLQQQVVELDAKLQERTTKLNEAVRDCNRCAVIMNSIRSVVEELTASPDDPLSERIYRKFDMHYKRHMEMALRDGALTTPLHNDDGFATTLPKTHRFISKMLKGAEELYAAEQSDNSPSP